MRILIIEDEKRLADSLKALLESRGFTVETAYDGETGAEYAELGIYDLLILDVMMPGLNGYALARQVRARRCAVPILMLTAKSEVLDRIEGLNAGSFWRALELCCAGRAGRSIRFPLATPRLISRTARWRAVTKKSGFPRVNLM